MSESRVKSKAFLHEFKKNAQWSLARYVALYKILNEPENTRPSQRVPNSFVAAHLLDDEFNEKVVKITSNLLES